jgi:hypothetical protein
MVGQLLADQGQEWMDIPATSKEGDKKGGKGAG